MKIKFWYNLVGGTRLECTSGYRGRGCLSKQQFLRLSKAAQQTAVNAKAADDFFLKEVVESGFTASLPFKLMFQLRSEGGLYSIQITPADIKMSLKRFTKLSPTQQHKIIEKYFTSRYSWVQGYNVGMMELSFLIL